MLHAEHVSGVGSEEHSDHVSFRAESVFPKIPLRLLNTYAANIMTKQFEFELCKFELLTSVI